MANGSLIFDLLPTARFILDAGCGARGGHWWPRLTPAQQLIAVDLLERPTRLPVGAGFFPMDMVRFCGQEPRAGLFDSIAADQVLEHVPNPQPVTLGFAQVATPSACVHAGIPDSRNLTERFYHLVYPEGGGPISRLTLEGLIDLMKHAGFAEVRHERWADDRVGFREFSDWRGRRVKDVSQEDVDFVADTLAKGLPPGRGDLYGWGVVFGKEDRVGGPKWHAAGPAIPLGGPRPVPSRDGGGIRVRLDAAPDASTVTSGATLPLVSVIVLNYNGREDLAPCLESLGYLDYPAAKRELIVVDNGSGDGSAKWVQQTHPEVRLVANPSNLGFAGGIWSGVVAGTGEYLAFLNADMRVDPAWLRALVHTVQDEPGVVCAGSLILNWEGTHIDYAGRPRDALNLCPEPPAETGPGLHGEGDVPLLFASGGAMLIEREVFLSQGGFDPDYFLYHEDVDLGWRLWATGHEVRRSTQSIVYHRGGAASRQLNPRQVMLHAQKYSLYTLIKDMDDDQLWPVLPGIMWFLVERTKWFDSARDSLGQAVQEVARESETIWEKRKALQAARFRSDVEVFARCGQPVGFLGAHGGAARFGRVAADRMGRLSDPPAGARELAARLELLLSLAVKFNQDELSAGTPESSLLEVPRDPGSAKAPEALVSAALETRPAPAQVLMSKVESIARRILPASVRSRIGPTWYSIRRRLTPSVREESHD